jgi:hypothetical protein
MAQHDSVTVDHAGLEVTPEEIRKLLACAYGLLAMALPLALERLRTGGACIEDQRDFWRGFFALEESLTSVVHVKPDYEALMQAYLVHDDEPMETDFYDLAASVRRWVMK